MLFKKLLLVLLSFTVFAYALPNSNKIGVPSSETIVHNGITYGTVTSPYTGRVWLDRNLGASRVCTDIIDVQCFGDYYQWGRDYDGHEKFDSQVTEILAGDIYYKINKFIKGSRDWLSNTNIISSIPDARAEKWSKTDGSTVCPFGFRVPTVDEFKQEFNEEANRDTAYNSFLKIPGACERIESGYYRKNGNPFLWTVSQYYNGEVYGSPYAFEFKYLNSGNQGEYAALGLSVRCIKDTTPQNQHPKVNAGSDKNAIIGQSITLSATDSNDNDGNIVSYEWKEGDTVLSKQESFTKSDFSVGEHNITLTVTDDDGASSSDTVMVNILERQDWLVNIDSKYDVSKGEPFGIEFDVNLYDIYPLLGQEERASIIANKCYEVKFFYTQKEITVNGTSFD